jgi:hypothetical protein
MDGQFKRFCLTVQALQGRRNIDSLVWSVLSPQKGVKPSLLASPFHKPIVSLTGLINLELNSRRHESIGFSKLKLKL